MAISLFSFVPIITGILATYFVIALAGTRFEIKGVVGPYFGALAIMFGLFASLMAGDTWRETAKAKSLVAQEFNALSAINSLSDSYGEGAARIRELTKRYAEQDIATDKLQTTKDQITFTELPALVDLQSFIINDESGTAFLKSRLFLHIDALRDLRLQRLEIKRNHSGPRKLAMLILLGTLTQIAIAMCHAGNKSAAMYTVGLFTLAFGLVIHFVTVFDSPENFEQIVDFSILLEIP
ncbi:hypothetical protein [Reinekea sp.]|jgi:hypothetical protein|uniref:bestrophin-like domain n=1 Tax=Reinekea sp. TaxID=1970455 RepID=UPI0025794964|nr:hypothetical protein [Reinekea sp.]